MWEAGMRRTEERRKFIRLGVPVDIKYIIQGDSVRKEAITKDLSCEGLRFTTTDSIKEGSGLELKLDIPDALNPVHISANVVWVKRLSTEDGSPFDLGVEFTKIE